MDGSHTGSVPGFAIALSAEALAELEAMGLHGSREVRGRPADGIGPVEGRPLVPKRAMSAPEVLNEAYDYAKPSSFSRGMRVELPGATLLLLSGTASVDEEGRTVHPGDFAAQCLRTYRNLTRLLAAEGCKKARRHHHRLGRLQRVTALGPPRRSRTLGLLRVRTASGADRRRSRCSGPR